MGNGFRSDTLGRTQRQGLSWPDELLRDNGDGDGLRVAGDELAVIQGVKSSKR
jgi:hypothetical protein